MTLNKLTLVFTLLISSYSIFSPLNALIDHFFDFHLDVDRIQKDSRKDGFYEKDGILYENEYMYEYHNQGERDNDRNDRGTTLDGPDRDK